jgi:hypothetical protein
MTYQNVFVKEHYIDGVEADRGHIRSNSVIFDLSYGVTDRLAVNIGIPYVRSKYYGAFPHPTALDDGSYHGTFSDYHASVRYLALREPVVATPFVAVLIPGSDYEYLAHSGAGRRLEEYIVGVNLGRRLDPILSNGYVHARYSYAFVDSKTFVGDVNRSNVGLELGYFPTSSLGLRAFGAYAATHGGLTNAQTPRTDPIWRYHDRVHDIDHLEVGGGVTVAVTGSMDVSASYFTGAWGTNGHKVKDGIVIGVGWNFSPQQFVRRLFPSRTAGRDPAIP